ncbi:MAG: very short patch repair endonuclease [Rhodobacteraceae bacterium]|nr:MAG: very short patch repair endonuclease [Paracoccaceae bacterium]
MVDRISKIHRSWNMSRIRNKNTRPELLLRSLLHRKGFRFRLHDSGLPGKPDIVLRRYRTAIFVNGCYWHRHKNCSRATMPKTRISFWQEKFEKTIERDQRKTRELRLAGWHVITVWECELENSPDILPHGLAREIKGAD